MTFNNPLLDEPSVARFKDMLTSGALYARAQLERGETGTLHWQACVGYEKNWRKAAIIKRFKGCHVSLSKNALAAWRYCGKEESRDKLTDQYGIEHGVPPAARNVKGDLKARNKLILTTPLVDLVEQGTISVMQLKKVKEAREMFSLLKQAPATLPELDNEWHYGKTGMGKSRNVRERFPEAYIKGNNVWWDGYDGQETVIIEEMGPKQIGAHHMKKWCDHYPFSAESKGSSVQIRPKRLLVTSNYSIEDCYPEP